MARADSGFADDETFSLLGRIEDIEEFFNFPADDAATGRDGDGADGSLYGGVSAGAVVFSDMVDAHTVGSSSSCGRGGGDAVTEPGSDSHNSAPAGALHTVASSLSHVDMGVLGPFDDLVMADDIADEIAWLSNFLEDSGSYSHDVATIPTSNVNLHSSGKVDNQFQTSSPVSVLEPNSHTSGGTLSSSSAPDSTSSSSSSSSGFGVTSNANNGCQFINNVNHPEPVVIPGRARTRRPRPASVPCHTHFSNEFAIPLFNESQSFDGSNTPTKKEKKKKIRVIPTIAADDTGANVEENSLLVRKCTHCEITKTPQWRAGPRGPKTLCNACGVRYKSGRLFPEYRPAASPTFTPAQHSNSHKKVVEMRIKASQRTTAPLPDNPAAKGCDLLQFIRVRDRDT